MWWISFVYIASLPTLVDGFKVAQNKKVWSAVKNDSIDMQYMLDHENWCW